MTTPQEQPSNVLAPENVPAEIRPFYALLVDRAVSELKLGRSDIELRVELQKLNPSKAVVDANIDVEQMISYAIDYAKYVVNQTPTAEDIAIQPIIDKLGAVEPPKSSDLFQILKQLRERERVIRTAGFEAQRTALRENLADVDLVLKAAEANLTAIRAQQANRPTTSISFPAPSAGDQTISFNPAPQIVVGPPRAPAPSANTESQFPSFKSTSTPGQESITISGDSNARRQAVDQKIAAGFVLISAKENVDGSATFTFERTSGSSNNNVPTAPSGSSPQRFILAGDLQPGAAFTIGGTNYRVIELRPNKPGDEVLAFSDATQGQVTVSKNQRVGLL